MIAASPVGRALADDLVVIGMGGNLDGDEAIVARMRAARERFRAWGHVRASRIFRTAPIGPEQPEFLNAALAVHLGEIAPEELIEGVLAVERDLGRVRDGAVRFGARAIDLDVLLWGSRIIRHDGPPALYVPHPRLTQRRFALLPALDVVSGNVDVPGTGETLAALATRTVEQRVVETDLAL